MARAYAHIVNITDYKFIYKYGLLKKIFAYYGVHF